MEASMYVNTGPLVGSSLVFVPINVAVFFLSLILIIRIGRGRLNIPIIFISLGFLASAFVPLLIGVENLWVVPLIQTFFSALGILLLMKVFGVFTLIFKSNKSRDSVNSIGN